MATMTTADVKRFINKLTSTKDFYKSIREYVARFDYYSDHTIKTAQAYADFKYSELEKAGK